MVNLLSYNNERLIFQGQPPLKQQKTVHRQTVHGHTHRLRQVTPSPSREQDEKIFVRNKKFVYGKALTVYSLLALPIIYFAYVFRMQYRIFLWDIGERSTQPALSPLPLKQCKEI